MKDIAILGGTFNPIHNGHLIAAEFVYDTKKYDKIIFMPTGDPPHKDGKEVINKEHRLNMCQLAINHNENFEISTMEIDRKGTTYTVETIAELKKLNPGIHYHLIIGNDSLMQLLNWRNPKELFKICNFIVVNRPGYTSDEIIKQMDYLSKKYDAKFSVIDIPDIHISSSEIRHRVSLGKSIKYLVHHCVEEYIRDNYLYIDSDTVGTEIEKELKKRLSTKRFEHTMGVKKTAVALAKRYNCDVIKAAMAALLHDCAKNNDDKKNLKLCDKYGINLTKAEKHNPELIHAKLGAAIANDKYEIIDQEILNAIKWHTTGKPDMTLLEKIIYIADYIEPTRDKAPNLDYLRVIAYESLDATMFLILKDTMLHLESKDKVIDSITKQTYLYYKKYIKQRKVDISQWKKQKKITKC